MLRSEPPVGAQESADVARLLNAGCAILASSVLADSSMEHYRGSFENKAMFVPPIVSTLALIASLHGASDRSARAERRRDAIYALSAAAAAAGFGFHLYNVGKRDGGFCWENFFYAAPIGAPWALLLSGTLGVAAERVRDTRPGGIPHIFGIAAGRLLAGLTSAGLLGTVGEVWLLHFRGAFQDPFMYLPVTLPPVGAGLLASAALSSKPKKRPLTRFWMKLVTVLGLAGMGFHIYGVHRNMGGWRNWSQNVLNGPPIPAPPSFTGLGLAGLAALRLLEGPKNE
ncbi:MAG: hypothetical protein JOY71_18165 [Acetobacteraceae bacterium]|nr:hypothetical protein [Acetobacteraceae bacterium]